MKSSRFHVRSMQFTLQKIFYHFQRVLYSLALRGYERKEKYSATEALRKELAIPPLLRTDTLYHQEQGQEEWSPDLHSGKSNMDWCLQREGIRGIKINRRK